MTPRRSARSVKMVVDVEFLRRVVVQADDCRDRSPAAGRSRPHPVCRIWWHLPSSDSQAGSARRGERLRPCSERHDAFPHARNAGDHRRATQEVAAIDHFVEAGNNGRHPGPSCRTRRPIAARHTLRLHAPVHLDSLSAHDPEGMAPPLENPVPAISRSRRSARGALQVSTPQPDDGIGDRFLVQRSEIAAVQAALASSARTAVSFARCRPGPGCENVSRESGSEGRRQQAAGTIDEDPPGAELLACFVEEQAVGLLHLLSEYFTRRVNDLQALLLSSSRRSQPRPAAGAPAFRGHLEHHDDAG